MTEEWSREDLGRFSGRFFSLCGAVGAVALYGRTGSLWWVLVAVVAAELARTYAVKHTGLSMLAKVRDGLRWALWKDPRWRNVPRLARWRNRLFGVGLVLLLLVPGVAANEATDGTLGMMTYQIAAESFNLGPITPAGAGEVLNFTYNASRPHAFEVVDHRLVMGVSMTHSVLQDSVGEWNITIYQDGVPLNGCSYVFPTENVGGFLAGEFETYPPYGLSCIRLGATSLNNEDHTHTITVEFQVESGTPADIDNSFISFGIQRRDVYVIPDSIEISNLWTYLPIGLALVIFVVGEYRRDFALRAIAGLLILGSIIPAAQEFPVFILGAMAALGFYLLLMYLLSDTDLGRRLRRN